MNPHIGERMVSLKELMKAARERKAVFVPKAHCWSKPKPAAFMINQSGAILYTLFDKGMFIYEKQPKGEQDG